MIEVNKAHIITREEKQQKQADKASSGNSDSLSIFDKTSRTVHGLTIEKISDDDIKNDNNSDDNNINDNVKVPENTDNSTVKIDKRIGKFEQSKTANDCWLVASIKALFKTKEGAQAIKDAISQDPDTGNVTVTLKTGDSYTFTPQEINDAESRLSTGDDDVRVLEMAVEKHRKKEMEECQKAGKKYKGCGTTEIPLMYGTPEEAIKLIAGKLSTELEPSHNTEWNLIEPLNQNTYLDLIEKYPDKYCALITFDKEDTSRNIVPKHLYVIDHVEGDNIMLINPWNSDERTLISRDELLTNCKYMNTVTFETNKTMVFDKLNTEFPNL